MTNWPKIVLVLTFACVAVENAEVGTWWTEMYYPNMPVDHFAYGNQYTFPLRYLINSTSLTPGGPIFFYCGNEGGIELFAKNTGFMWDIAPEFGAMVVFAEHRYYGKTLPFGNHSYSSVENRAFLTSEQALADYSVLIHFLKKNNTHLANSPVIAFGGSYGGMLASWFRIKYPHVVAGALASSAPILQFEGVYPCYRFSEIVTNTYRNSGSGHNCDVAIKRSWTALQNVFNTDSDWINKNFGLCPNSTVTGQKTLTQMMGWLENAWTYLAMIDYPYPTNFLNPVPGWPVRVACSAFANYSVNTTDKDLLSGIYTAVSVYLNHTGSVSCYSFKQVATSDLGDSGWDYQYCTEMVMPFCNNGTDMLRTSPWNLTSVVADCATKYNVTSRPYWVLRNYGAGGLQFRYASNIIFSNGLLDPWFGGSVTTPIPGNPSVHVINIPQAAHHLDLRSSDPGDTSFVITARNQEKTIIRNWITAYNNPTASASSRLNQGAISNVFIFVTALWILL